jgi:YVTN family beta-propeller protein
VGRSPLAIAITPDGKTAYVANFNSENVSAIDTATNSVAKTITVGTNPEAIATAFTPDEPPSASFTSAPRARPSVPLILDASASKDPDSPIQSYAWNFGDGQSQSLSTPKTTHTFRTPGIYTVSLRETDAEGCSSVPHSFLFAGQTVLCNGNVGAQVSKKIKVAYPGVRVRCPKGAKPKGCAFGLQAVAKKPNRGKAPRFESALAKAKVKAGHSRIVSLQPKQAFAKKLAIAKRILVKETVTAGKSKTRYLKLRVVR